MAGQKNNKVKILCAMSGGVDSSVAAALLVRRGYDVTGAFMVNYQASPDGLRPTSSEEFTGRSEAETCWTGDYQDALRVAAKLGIPLIRLNFIKEYQRQVLDYMYSEYEAGRTPNPDVLCNKFIKFGAWLDQAKKLGFEYFATGHYARLRFATHGQAVKLLMAEDENKDQTYFLHQLNQKQLRQVIFPVGDYTKIEVRKMAKKFVLPTAGKEESMGICFVGEVPMKEFLLKKIKPRPGKIITSGGKILGKHEGLPFYTIGERGLGVKDNSNKPLYVVAKRTETNELVVGYANDHLLYKKQIAIADAHWISGHEPKFPLKCEVRLRHRQPLLKATVKSNNTVIFSEPQRAVTPGQFAVFYKNYECLGGGVIL